MTRPVTIALREDSRNPGHVTLSVFTGRNEGARGHSGTIVMRTDEWDELLTSGSILVDILPKRAVTAND